MHTALPRRIASSDLRDGLAVTRSNQILMALSANALLAISAHVSLPLFFTPVPLTLQTFAVILTGFALGPSLAFYTLLLYLAEGAFGLPVFSPAGPGGFAQLIGVTGGFLMSYPLAAALAGFLVRAPGARRSRFGSALMAGSGATVIILLGGGAWIAHVAHTNLGTTATLGVTPFLPGEVIKVIAAAASYTGLQRYFRR